MPLGNMAAAFAILKWSVWSMPSIMLPSCRRSLYGFLKVRMLRRAVQAVVAVVNDCYVDFIVRVLRPKMRQARQAKKQLSYGCLSQRRAEKGNKEYSMMTDIIVDT